MKTTTDAENFTFSFTVTDLARFLGKSPVTLRHWERQGLVVFPRDSNGDRRLSTGQVRYMAQVAKQLGRITEGRLHMVEAAIFLLETIERQNATENRPHRGAHIGQNGTCPTTQRSPTPA